MAIETIEHARDIRTLLDYTAKRLKPSSRLFVQSLLHQSRAYRRQWAISAGFG